MVAVVVCLGAAGAATGLALDQPPKSSSWVTIGFAGVALSLLPQPPKSSVRAELLTAVVAGALYVEGAVDVWGGAGRAGSGSGVLHALSEPHASIPLIAEKLAVDVGALD